MQINNNQYALLALVRAGLWTDNNDNLNYKVDWNEVYRLAVEQSVQGLVLAGIERLRKTTPYLNLDQEFLLQWIGEVQMLEQQNKAMNQFIAELIEKMRKADIYTMLVKGQGVAQCYEKPLWRTCGDVDLYLSKDNYARAKSLLCPLASSVNSENCKRKHLNMSIDSWVVELHGSMYTEVSSRMNQALDEIHKSIFYEGNVRSWMNGKTQVFLPSADNDVIIVFTHFISHFYGAGVGLKQICDWCRLLWTYKSSLNQELLEARIQKAGLLTEWKAFAAFAVNYLGMPVNIMPLYTDSKYYKNKACKICKLILETGNMGHNKDNSYRSEYSKTSEFIITFFRRLKKFARLSTIFPCNAPKFFMTYLINRVRFVL